MIDAFVGFCLHRRIAIIVLAVLLSGFGIYAWETLSVEAYPDLGDVAAQVTTQMPGLAAEEVEQLITVPLERQINGTPGLFLMRSTSTFGLSLITVLFRDGYEDYWARQRLTERINQAVLPNGAAPSLDPVAGPAGEIYRYTLESDTKNLQQLSEIQRWIVMPALRSVSGVVDDTNFGGFTTEYQLNLEPRQLEHFGIGITDVINAINNNNANAGGGRVSRGDQSYVIRGVGLIHSLADIGSIVVTQVNGTPVLVRDLGSATLSHQEREGVLGKDNNPDTIEGIVLMLKYQNPSRTLAGVHAKVAELNAKLASEGVKVVPYIDRDELVKATIEKVGRTIAEGITLVFLILILFLGSPRSALVVAVTIPLALVAVFSLLNLTHVSANLLSLGAIDFGILVDGAIVVMESVLRRREAMPNEEMSESEAKAATLQVTRPIFFASLIIITAYLPLFSFERAEAKLFTPIAYTMGYALFGALLTALALVPGLAYLAFRKPGRVYENKWLGHLTVGYDRVLEACLEQPRIIYGVVIFALLAVVGFGATVGRDFLPDLDEGALWLQVQMPTGLSLNKASDMASDLRRALLKYPQISYAVTQTGRNDDGTDPWTMSHIEAPVGLKPYDTWPGGESKKHFVDRLAADLGKQLPGYSIGISQPIIDGVNDMIGGAHSPLVIKIYGDDLDLLRRIGGEIVDVLYTVDGTSSASLFQEPPIPQVEIKLDHDKAARYGVNMTDVQNVIQTGVGQFPVSTVYVRERIYPLTVRFTPESRDGAGALGNLPVKTSGGAQIPLSQIADIRVRSGESTVTRENGQRNLTIRIDNRDRDLTSYLEEAQSKIAQKVHFDKNAVHLEWAGQFENQRRAEQRLLVILGLVMGLMLIFLTIGTGSLRQALLILSVVPLATLGGLISLHLTGQTLNVASGVGFIALFGVAVQNGIIMVSNLNRMRKSGLELHEAIMKGATERLRPVLMTASVATLGMLPAALHTGVGSDVQRGIATVVVGGLAISTLLTLVVLPSMYHVIEHWAEQRHGVARWGWGKVMRKRIALRAPCAWALCAALSACAVGPNYKRPPAPATPTYGGAVMDGALQGADTAGGATQQLIKDMDIPAQWWTLFQSPKLDHLVEQALKGSPDVGAAQAALRQAHELYSAQWTALIPTVQGDVTGDRSQFPAATLTSPTTAPNNVYNLFTAQLTLSYVPDIFGGTRRAIEQAKAQEESTRFQLEATYLTLSSNVVVTAVQEASLRGQIAATIRLLELQHQLTEKIRQQRTLGTADDLDLLAQQALEAQTAQTLPPLQKQLGQTRDALTALLGRLPADEPEETFNLEDLTLPTDLPVSVPSKLVAQRPDVRQAEENMHAASAAVGIATADLLPQFAINADVGSSALKLQKLFSPYTSFWDLGATLSETLFDAGALLHRRRAAIAALDQAGAQYRAAVILACQNVADTLRALRSDADALKANDDAARAAKSAFDLAQRQKSIGTISLVAVLNAEQAYRQAELSLVQAQANRYADSAGLFQALGGGWWNRSTETKYEQFSATRE